MKRPYHLFEHARANAPKCAVCQIALAGVKNERTAPALHEWCGDCRDRYRSYVQNRRRRGFEPRTPESWAGRRLALVLPVCSWCGAANARGKDNDGDPCCERGTGCARLSGSRKAAQ